MRQNAPIGPAPAHFQQLKRPQTRVCGHKWSTWASCHELSLRHPVTRRRKLFRISGRSGQNVPSDTLSIPFLSPNYHLPRTQPVPSGTVRASSGHSRSHPRPTQRRRRAAGRHRPFTLRPPPPPPNPFPTGRTSRARTSPPPWQAAQRKRRASSPWPCSCTRGPRPTGRK